MDCYFLWVFIAKSETNVFNFTAAALGRISGWIPTVQGRLQQKGCPADTQSDQNWFLREQLKGCSVISSTQALFPTFPTNPVLCRTHHHEQQTRAESPGKGKNFWLRSETMVWTHLCTQDWKEPLGLAFWKKCSFLCQSFFQNWVTCIKVLWFLDHN